MSTRRLERGYTLVEMLISVGIMVTVTGTIFSLVNPSQGISRVQPEFSDMQQRGRVGGDILTRDLLMAGAGPYLGTTTGSLLNYFPPILPYRSGRVNPDLAGTYKTDTISVVYVPQTSSQTFITSEMPNESAELKVEPQNNCPAAEDLCGFEAGESLLIFDVDGSWDAFEVTEVQDNAAHLQHRGQQFQKTYGLGAVVVEAKNHTYYWDSVNLRLMHYDGLVTEMPVLDNVVGLTFTYFGDPNPPLLPKPPFGTPNCLFDALGIPVLPTLPATSGSLIELTEDMLDDGPFCGAGTNRFDADLYRIRKVRIRIRVQTGDPGLRPRADQLAASPRLREMFARPGTGMLGPGGNYVPDYELQFEVTPRNLNLAR